MLVEARLVSLAPLLRELPHIALEESLHCPHSHPVAVLSRHLYAPLEFTIPWDLAQLLPGLLDLLQHLHDLELRCGRATAPLCSHALCLGRGLHHSRQSTTAVGSAELSPVARPATVGAEGKNFMSWKEVRRSSSAVSRWRSVRTRVLSLLPLLRRLGATRSGNRTAACTSCGRSL